MRDVSKEIVWVLGTWMSIDEMMVRFMGRLAETYQMRNKPISEGYNFFVISTSDGLLFISPLMDKQHVNVTDRNIRKAMLVR